MCAPHQKYVLPQSNSDSAGSCLLLSRMPEPEGSPADLQAADDIELDVSVETLVHVDQRHVVDKPFEVSIEHLEEVFCPPHTPCKYLAGHTAGWVRALPQLKSPVRGEG